MLETLLSLRLARQDAMPEINSERGRSLIAKYTDRTLKQVKRCLNGIVKINRQKAVTVNQLQHSYVDRLKKIAAARVRRTDLERSWVTM